ncbi:MAG: hypothetical protein M1562_01915 [Candidatus Marsarchaeota archaeon]|nr:hypothetical protein [Candidatus Marsarchaeota archaeon]
MLDERSERFAKACFSRYYKSTNISINHAEKREFGFGNFEKKIMFRHISFKDNDHLLRYIREHAPPFISYSPSLYKFPDARPMERKVWEGSELVFDIDSNDLELSCQKGHGRSWVCDNCQSAVKAETLKLIEEFLIPDFGFSKDEIKVNFSGNRGYHIHVTAKNISDLGSDQRKEISDYISGRDISIREMFPTIGKRSARLEGPKPNDPGWGGRIANGMIIALNSGIPALRSLGMGKREAELMYGNRTNVILGITNGNWDKVSIPKKEEFWTGVVNTMTIKQSDSIDGNVTSSVYHLLRMPNTLHGDTALLSRPISSIHRLGEFEPMRHAVVFKKGEEEVELIRDAPTLYMNGMTFGPYKSGAKQVIPTYAALYLILKRYARSA